MRYTYKYETHHDCHTRGRIDPLPCFGETIFNFECLPYTGVVTVPIVLFMPVMIPKAQSVLEWRNGKIGHYDFDRLM